jgi:hypothetical protein
MPQTTVDYTSVRQGGGWGSLENVAADDSSYAQASPDNVTGSIHVDDAPVDYNGTSINTVKLSINWDISGTATRPKFVVVTWYKSDGITIIHQYTTPDKSSAGEVTNGDPSFVTPTGTTSLTTSEWDDSYFELFADEGGGKGDDIIILVDYVKIEVDYNGAALALEGTLRYA